MGPAGGGGAPDLRGGWAEGSGPVADVTDWVGWTGVDRGAYVVCAGVGGKPREVGACRGRGEGGRVRMGELPGVSVGRERIRLVPSVSPAALFAGRA
ncbi:hypothetical protein GCM10023205_25170 [Yinghuangia aomiensis]|uniref:Uncharacterized protein n=1 Tax=Yinghuangia aomiensis TaxID=676205 RepID=A0ABP9H3K0_9ACTN